jgi:hypothetical protein
MLHSRYIVTGISLPFFAYKVTFYGRPMQLFPSSALSQSAARSSTPRLLERERSRHLIFDTSITKRFVHPKELPRIEYHMQEGASIVFAWKADGLSGIEKGK